MNLANEKARAADLVRYAQELRTAKAKVKTYNDRLFDSVWQGNETVYYQKAASQIISEIESIACELELIARDINTAADEIDREEKERLEQERLAQELLNSQEGSNV